jgi:hypothetical protein
MKPTVLQMRFRIFLNVSWVMAGTFGPLHGATITPSTTPSTQTSAAGLLLAGVVLIGIGRFRFRKKR